MKRAAPKDARSAGARRVWTAGLLGLLALSQAGCGIAMQSMMGWRETRHEYQSKTHRVHVTSEPEGAQVERVQDGGPPVPLGVVPTEDELRTSTTINTDAPAFVGLILGSTYEFGGALAAAIAADDPGTKLGVSLTLATMMIADLVALGVHASSESRVLPAPPAPGPRPVRYHATLEGVGEGYAEIIVPGASEVRLVLTASATPPWPLVAPPPPPPWSEWVVELGAVETASGSFDTSAIEDGLRQRILDREIRVTESGDRMASHRLTVTLSRTGDQCAIEALLFDKSELRASAVVHAGCDDVGMRQLLDGVARRLFGEDGSTVRRPE